MKKHQPFRRSMLPWLTSLLLGLLTLFWIWYRQVAVAPGSELSYVNVSIEGHKFNLEVADTPETRAKGVAGKYRLNDGEGMLFIFDYPGKECFWMKDVGFSIDMLWFDENKRLIHLEKNVSPKSYPDSFCPPSPALYVVELQAGTASEKNFKLGSVLKL